MIGNLDTYLIAAKAVLLGKNTFGGLHAAVNGAQIFLWIRVGFGTV